MGRLITFVVGVLVGVVLKWHYDVQATLTPAAQPAGRRATTDQPAVGELQEIAITVVERNPAAVTPLPASPSENRATPPDGV
jgi:hypothetical protein